MSRKSPAFSFYPNDWFEGTMLMTAVQKAAYIDLLSLQWVRGGFTRENAHLAVRGVEPSAIDAVIDEKFEQQQEGWFTNSRLEAEREKQAKRSKVASENGSKGGRPKANQKLNESQNKATAKANSKAKPKPAKKLSVLDSVSVSGLDSDLGSNSETLSLPVRSDLRNVLPGRLRSERFFEVVELWANTRASDGVPIDLDPITLKTQLAKLTGLTDDELFESLANAAGGGWKNLRRPDPPKGGRSGNRGSGPKTFAQQKSANNQSQFAEYLEKNPHVAQELLDEAYEANTPRIGAQR